jgi:hypothetical protein
MKLFLTGILIAVLSILAPTQIMQQAIVNTSPPSGTLSYDFTTGSLPGGTTLTRGSSGTYLDSGGVLQTASTNVARFQYVSATPYLLYEPAATNLLKQSNAFTTTWFAQNTAVATGAQFTSVDGTNDGWSLTTGTGFGAVAQSVTVSAVAYAFSVWCKRITGTAPVNFQWAGNSWGGGFTTSTTLTRYTGTGTPTAGAANFSIQINAASGSTNGIFGAQLETGAVATSYIATTTSAGNRSADQLTFTIPSGIGHLTVTFSDNTTQSITVSPGSYTLTNTLNEYMIKTIVGSV